MQGVFPSTLFEVGPVVVSDTTLVSLIISVLLIGLGAVAVRRASWRSVLEVVYDMLSTQIREMVNVDASPLVPLVLTQWAFIAAANLIGLIPGVGSPTRDLAITSALAIIALAAGHVVAFRAHGIGYLKSYLEPTPLLLPLNLIGEVSRTLALSLRLFGNMLSGQLIGAIAVYLAGVLIPVPLMLLSVLVSIVQAYIFGVLTLVFAASSLQVAHETVKKAAPAPLLSGPDAVPSASETDATTSQEKSS